MTEPAVTIFRFHDCPQDWRDLSEHGGDEDHIIVGNPNDYDFERVVMALTRCDNHPVILPDGRHAVITAHA